MWSILVLCLFSFNVSAQSAPQIMSGTKSFHGDYRIVSFKNFQPIYLSNPAERSRMAHLQANGYICEYKTSTEAICSKFIQNPHLTEKLKAAILAKAQGLKFQFAQTRNAWELTNDAEVIREWEIEQSVQVYRHSELLSETNFWINIYQTEMFYVAQMRVTNGRNWDSLLVEYALD
jgi:hypothetical protein